MAPYILAPYKSISSEENRNEETSYDHWCWCGAGHRFIWFSGTEPARTTARTSDNASAGGAERRSLRQQRCTGNNSVSTGVTRGQRQQCPCGRAPECGELGSIRSGDLEIRAGIQCSRQFEDMESGPAQNDAGRKSYRRHSVQFDGSGGLLCDGKRRIRVYLDRNAA